jgi:hypothetical protein
MPEKARGVLDFVNDDGRGMTLEEALRLFFGLLGFRGKI